MSAYRRRKTHSKLAPMLECLIEALEVQDTDDRSGAARALRAFGHVATREIPTRGAFAADNPDLFSVIEDIADQHLSFQIPREAFMDATTNVSDRSCATALKTTAAHMQTISDQA